MANSSSKIDSYGRYKGRQYDAAFFARITTEEQAYWLGFIRADGYLVPSKNTVGVTLAAQDKGHLIKLARAVGLEASAIKTYKPTKQYKGWQVQDSVRLLFGRKAFYQSFVDLGYCNRKASYKEFPPLPEHLLRHFIRGMFDGDGTVGIYFSEGKRRPITRYGWGISVPNEVMAILLMRTVEQAIAQPLSLIRDHDIWSVRSMNQPTLRLLFNYLYEGATVWLERKRLKFEEAIKEKNDEDQKPAA